MKGFLIITSLFLFLSQIILSIALRSEIIVDKLDSLDDVVSGITKTINLNDSQTLSDISVFGWIYVIFSGDLKQIIELNGASSNQSPSADNPAKKDLIFFLQYLSWITPKLKFGCYINGKEEFTYFELSPLEQKTWMFVYLGHSFQNLKQTYYLKSMLNEQIVTKPVNKIENVEFCLISAGVGYYDAREFIYGKIDRLIVQIGVGAYKETDFAVLYENDPDNLPGCAVGYEQCGYIGQPIGLCGELKKPKSVLLQGMKSVTICAFHQEIIVKRNINCIDDGNFISLKLANAIVFSDNPNDQCLNQ